MNQAIRGRVFWGALLLAGGALAFGCGTRPLALDIQGESVLQFDQLNAPYRLSARAWDENGRALQSAKVRYVSSDPAVAEVSAAGVIVPKSDGVARVFALAGPAEKQVLVRVRAAATLEASKTLLGIERGDSEQVTAMAFDQAGFPVANMEVSWRTLSPEVVAVDQTGRIFAVGEGGGVIVIRAGGLERAINVIVLSKSSESAS